VRKVLIASPIRQKPAILRAFLDSLGRLETTGLDVSFAFIDDSEGVERAVLWQFTSQQDDALILDPECDCPGEYKRDETTHFWDTALMSKLAVFRNRFLQMALDGGYDYLFMVDSDLVLHPKTLAHLVGLGKDIVSEVFWTRWQPNDPPMPQVWLSGQYTTTPEFVEALKQPGVYPVGGLGACTLISRKAIEAGVSYSEVLGIDLVGEDRHFCARAAALGLEMWADTHYPPKHLYRESDLGATTLSLCMIVKDEATNLHGCLPNVMGLVDEIILVDTGSSDYTKAVAKGYGAKVFDAPWTGDFAAARNESLKHATGDWILVLDADEMLAQKGQDELHRLLQDSTCEAFFLPIINYAGAGEQQVRTSVLRLFRNRPEYRFEGAIHEQILPAIQRRGGAIGLAPVTIQHYGYLDTEIERQGKVKRNLAIALAEVEKKPKDSLALYGLGMEYLRSKEYELALQAFKRSMEHLPSQTVQYASRLMLDIALCLYMTGRSELALEFLGDAQRLYPTYTDLWHLQGHIHLSRGECAEAAEAFRECLRKGESDPRHISDVGVGSHLAQRGLDMALAGLVNQSEEVKPHVAEGEIPVA
jgi:glycosyltransferase involved in cell wall biosynthesis